MDTFITEMLEIVYKNVMSPLHYSKWELLRINRKKRTKVGHQDGSTLVSVFISVCKLDLVSMLVRLFIP